MKMKTIWGERIEVLLGLRGKKEDRAVTLRELSSLQQDVGGVDSKASAAKTDADQAVRVVDQVNAAVNNPGGVVDQVDAAVDAAQLAALNSVAAVQTAEAISNDVADASAEAIAAANTAREDAIAARDVSTANADASIEAATTAEADRIRAETAKSASEAARDVSVSAQTGAEDAQAASLTNATSAAQSESNAGTQASAAANSATLASTKASEAETSAVAANTSRVEALSAESSASISRTEAAQSATTAAGSASTATQQAQIAVAAGDGLIAEVATLGTAVADIDDTLSATYSIKVGAGGAASLLELVASDNPTGPTVSFAKISADDILLDGTVAANKLVVGSGGNLIENSNLSQGLRGYRLINGGGMAATAGVLSLRAAGGAYAGATYPTIRVFQSTNAGSGYSRLYTQAIDKLGNQSSMAHAVTQGKSYIASAHVAHFNCTGLISIFWRDEAGNFISGSPKNIANISDPANPDEWIRSFVKGVAPAGARYANVVVQKNATASGSNNSTMFVHKPQFEQVHAAATEPSGYSPGAVSYIDGNSIITGSITAQSGAIADLAVDTLQIKGNAVTVTEFAFSNAILDPVSTGYTQILATPTVVRTSGLATYLTCSFKYRGQLFANQRITFDVQVRRGTTVIYQEKHDYHASVSGTSEFVISFSFVDTDTSGTNASYNLRVDPGSTAQNASFRHRTLTAQQFKR